MPPRHDDAYATRAGVGTVGRRAVVRGRRDSSARVEASYARGRSERGGCRDRSAMCLAEARTRHEGNVVAAAPRWLISLVVLLLVGVSAVPDSETPHTNGSVTVIKYENLDCTGAVVSNTSFAAGKCYINDTVGTGESFRFNCHHVVRPTCAFFRMNCSDGNQHGRVEERPCEICTATGVFTGNPKVFNYSCDETSQSVVFNTHCTNGHTRGVCGHCNHSSILHPNKCSDTGDGMTSELIKVGPCAVKVATMTFDSSNNCSSRPGNFAGLIASGQCDNRRGERRSCHMDEQIAP